MVLLSESVSQNAWLRQPNHLWAGWHGIHHMGSGVGGCGETEETVKHLIRPSATLLKIHSKKKKVSGSYPSDLQDQKLWWWDQPFLLYKRWASLWLTFLLFQSTAFNTVSWGPPGFLWTLVSTQQPILNHQVPSQSKILQQLPPHLNKTQTPYGGTASAPCLPLCFYLVFLSPVYTLPVTLLLYIPGTLEDCSCLRALPCPLPGTCPSTLLPRQSVRSAFWKFRFRYQCHLPSHLPSPGHFYLT